MMFDPFAAVAASIGDPEPPVQQNTDDLQTTLPVPPDAPPMNWRHPKYGAPSAIWAYRDSAGALLGYDARCDFTGPSGPDKVVLPVTWCGAAGWRAKGFPTPRPLYGLDRLAVSPAAPVIVAEGCKAADAAGQLLNILFVSWPGGCNGDHLADWSPLAGRDVLIWPDNDPEGVAAGNRIAARLVAAGGATVAVIDLEGLSEAKGWDAADALAAGWTREQAQSFASERAKPFSVPAEATASDGWGKPDMAVLALNRRPPPSFPPEVFGSLWPLVLDLAEGTGAPVDYVAAGLLAVAASLIGGKRRVAPFVQSDWTEPAVLWVGCVGEPSSNKSPALAALTRPIGALEADKARAFAPALQAYEEAKGRAAVERGKWDTDLKKLKPGDPTPPMPLAAIEPACPGRPRLMVMDATPEAIWTALEHNQQGLLNAHDEIAGWLANLERYNSDARAFWLQTWNGGQWTVDRKGRAAGPLILDFTGVSMLGGIQPDKLASALLSGDDDGMAARFVYFWPDKVDFRRPRQLADKARLEWLLRRLADLPWGVGERGEDRPIRLPLEPAAADLFEQWMAAGAASADDAGTLYKSWAGKAGALVLRVALVAEMLAWADGDAPDAPRMVTADTLGRVIDFADDYAKPMALRVFGDAALRPVDRNAATLAKHIRKAGLTTINARLVRRGPPKLPGLGEPSAMNEALALLVDADWLKPAPSREGGTTGRQSSDYLVNPAVLVKAGGNGPLG